VGIGVDVQRSGIAMDEERVSRRRWGLYIASAVDAVFITLVGEVIEGIAGNIATLM
jgi:hypothetical protein